MQILKHIVSVLPMFLCIGCFHQVKSNDDDDAKIATWESVELSAKAYCSDNSPYEIFDSNGTSSNLLIFFSGGGACWNTKTCANPTNTKTFRGGYYYPDVFDISKHTAGLLDKKNSKNPFNDWSFVVVPYCTGDLHLGNIQQTYVTTYSDTLAISYNGQSNVHQALEWVFEHYDHPPKILVAGESAGGFASIYWLPAIAEKYKNSSIYQLTDCSYINSDKMKDLIDSVWVSNSEEAFGYQTTADVLKNAYLNTNRLLEGYEVTYLQSNTLYDETMIFYLAELNNINVTDSLIKSWSKEMIQASGELDEKLENYAYYITDFGYQSTSQMTPHTLLWSDRFYSCEEDDTLYYDWLNKGVNQNQLSNVGEKYKSVNNQYYSNQKIKH